MPRTRKKSVGRYLKRNTLNIAIVAAVVLVVAAIFAVAVLVVELSRPVQPAQPDQPSQSGQQPGTTDWEEDCALTFFDLGKGNCYCWAAAVSYCARRLGYQAYVVAGWESSPTNDHAWTMIDWPDGETYLFDAQLEYAYWYMFSGKPKIDMFKASGDGVYYNGFAYFFP